MPAPWKPTGRVKTEDTTTELAGTQPNGYTISVTKMEGFAEWGRPKASPPFFETEWRSTGEVGRSRADIHMTPEAVDKMKQNEKTFADVMITVCDGVAELCFRLGHAIYEVGLDASRNSDGSLDIRVTNFGAFAGHEHQNPILVDAATCSVILQAFP